MAEDSDEETTEEQLLKTFQRFDSSGDGWIDREELAVVFREVDPAHWDEAKIDNIMKACDSNGDGRIDYSEFVAWLMYSGAEFNDAKDMAQLEGNTKRKKRMHVRDSRAFMDCVGMVEMTVVTTKSSKLGCKLASPQTLAIKAIEPKGLFAKWNSENRKAQVGPGDRIIQVNSFTTPKEILKELRKIGKLTIVVRPAEGSTQYKSHVDEVYQMSDHILDEGKLATVRRAKHKETDQQVVVKSVHKNSTTPETVEMAITMLKTLDHPNIVKLYDVFEDYLEWHLILEYCSGGEVFEKILTDTHFSEHQAARIQEQIFSAVAYMHSRGFCHRDLKPENLLLEKEAELERCNIKIIDWTNAKAFTPSTKFKTLVGTPEFTAPEIVKGLRYTYTCDLWSTGCLLYFMLAGYPPFSGETPAQIYAEVRRGNYWFPDEEFRSTSSEAKELINDLLKMDPDDRLPAAQAVRNPWIKTYGTVLIERSLLPEQRKMANYVGYSKFKKQALLVLSRHLCSEQLNELRKSFDLVDDNKDGSITYIELKAALERLGAGSQVEDFKELFESLDTNGTKRIEFSEFIAATMDKRHFREEAALWSAFQVFDRDTKGHIAYADITQLLEDDAMKGVLGDSTVDRVLKDFDKNGDGVIDFEEFMAMIRGDSWDGSL